MQTGQGRSIGVVMARTRRAGPSTCAAPGDWHVGCPPEIHGGSGWFPGCPHCAGRGMVKPLRLVADSPSLWTLGVPACCDSCARSLEVNGGTAWLPQAGLADRLMHPADLRSNAGICQLAEAHMTSLHGTRAGLTAQVSISLGPGCSYTACMHPVNHHTQHPSWANQHNALTQCISTPARRVQGGGFGH